MKQEIDTRVWCGAADMKTDYKMRSLHVYFIHTTARQAAFYSKVMVHLLGSIDSHIALMYDSEYQRGRAWILSASEDFGDQVL